MTQFINIVGVAGFAAGLLAEPADPKPLQADSGTVSFESVTNVPGIEVKGKSSALSAHVEIARDADKLVLHQMEASVPVKSLATGMKMRDEHMRQYIFRTADGQEPDLRFVSEHGECTRSSKSEFVCQLSGDFSIRGITKPVTLTLRAREEGGSAEAFKATGDVLVKLSTYGIQAPSQFGVKPADEVRIHVDFVAKQRPATAAGVLR